MPRSVLLVIPIIAACSSLAIAADGLIEIATADQVLQGRQMAFDDSACWLADREGKLVEVKLDKVKGFRQISPGFESVPLLELRDRLRKEYGKKFDIQARGNYVVLGPPGRASIYADLLNRVEADFATYFRVRKFELKPREFPLVAFVYPTRAQFEERCAADDVPVARSLRGYYQTKTNQIVFFDQTTDEAAAQALIDKEVARVKARFGSSKASSLKVQLPPPQTRTVADGLDGLSRDTTVHEAVHQLAYNSGLHSRVGQNPVWFVEGLAMQFENGEIAGVAAGKKQDPVNYSRLQTFNDYRLHRREPGSLTKIISGESVFAQSPVDAYSEAWMLTWYLIHTRPIPYSNFLQMLSVRGAVADYSAEQRLHDFKTSFGDDLAWFEVEFLRYAEDLAAENLPAAPKTASRR